MFFHSSPEYGAEFSRQDSRRGRRGEAGRVSERGLRAPLHDPRGRPDYSSANLLKTKRVDGQDGGIGGCEMVESGKQHRSLDRPETKPPFVVPRATLRAIESQRV